MEYLLTNLETNNFDGIVQSILLQQDETKEEPFLVYIGFLSSCVISNQHMKLYYQFLAKVFQYCATNQISIRQHLAFKAFYLNFEYVMNSPVIGTACATEYVDQVEKPSDDELMTLSDAYMAKLADSIDNDAPQMAYIKFFMSLQIFGPLKVASF